MIPALDVASQRVRLYWGVIHDLLALTNYVDIQALRHFQHTRPLGGHCVGDVGLQGAVAEAPDLRTGAGVVEPC
jgi:hypothetical protein